MSDVSVFKATPLSGWLTYLSAAAMLLSAGVLVSQAYSVTLDVKPGDGVSQRIVGPQAMLLFDSSWTILSLGAMLLLERLGARKWLYRLALAVSLALNSLFWLAGSAWEASWAAGWLALRHAIKDVAANGDAQDREKIGPGVLPAVSSFCSTLAAGAALGLLSWVLVTVAGAALIRLAFKDRARAQEGEEEVGEMYGAYGGGRSYADPAVEMAPPPRYS
ncbi:hypothetical protein N3K66_003422 [Trichothecium roseum]|uniref:Uncharacterized protein n=1 Tax=Trichothecium roseum TaxID=47278 RepID=A0ACC0V5D8_9HYPO|nr:hypothetical protein N3K66_003422 [Trichothecium roseum]